MDNHSRLHEVGWRLVFFASLMPALAGTAMLALAGWSSSVGFQEPWLSLVGRHNFCAAQIREWNPQMAALWTLTVHICGVNLLMSGGSAACLAFIPLREGKRWAWLLLLALFIWVGGNDAAALVRYRTEVGSGIPFTLAPLTLGLLGLALSRPAATTAK